MRGKNLLRWKDPEKGTRREYRHCCGRKSCVHIAMYGGKKLHYSRHCLRFTGKDRLTRTTEIFQPNWAAALLFA